MNYSLRLLVDQTPADVFAAVTDVRGWWSPDIEGHTHALNEEFTFRHKDIHVSTQRLTEVVAGERVVWRVVKARLTFAEDQHEWEGTDVVFEITTRGRQTELKFTHVGLVPTLGCFEGCSSGWSFFIGESLKALITTGQGKPVRAE